ncbi:MAG: carboxylate--amine ligase [Parcubacteria group bacterium]|nr:carboxylate--amine ligase [Parcubacteria group bacterium]
MKKILVCGAGGAPATNFVNSLRLMKGPMFLVGVDCNEYTLQRAKTDIRLLVPRVEDREYLPILNQIIKEYDIEFIHAQNDKEVEFLSQHREEVNTRTFLPDKKTVEVCLDKFASYQLWEQASLPIPRTVLIQKPQDLKEAFQNIGSYLWLRNRKGAAGEGSYPAKAYEDALSWIHSRNGWGRFTAAEVLTEHSVTWMSIWNKGTLVAAQGRERLYWEFANRAPSGVTGITGGGMTYSDPALDELALKAIKAIDQNPHGIFSVDLTYDKTGVPNPTEINIGRFFTTHFFFSKAGLNMPEIMLGLAFGEEYPEPSKIFNPLPDGLVWIRGMDVEPVLTGTKEIERCRQDLIKRKQQLHE